MPMVFQRKRKVPIVLPLLTVSHQIFTQKMSAAARICQRVQSFVTFVSFLHHSLSELMPIAAQSSLNVQICIPILCEMHFV